MFVSMASADGVPWATSMVSGDRHLAKVQPAALYSRQRSARPSRPCMQVSPDVPGSL